MSVDGTVKAWDLQSLPAADFGEVPVETERHEPWLVRDNRPFAFSLNSRQILAFGRGGRLQRWDLAGGREMEGPAIEHPGGRIVAISPDGILLATMGTDGCARLWNSHTGALRRTLPGRPIRTRDGSLPSWRFRLTGRCWPPRLSTRESYGSGRWTLVH